MKRYAVLVLVVFLVLLGVMPVATAKRNGTDRPFTGTVVGEASFDLANSKGCPAPPVGFGITTFTDAYGTARHMGEVGFHAVHCPLIVDGAIVDGSLTIVAANGDELYGTYSGSTEPIPATVGEVFLATIDIAFEGGTGRFAGASGTATLTAAITFEGFGELAWPWAATWTGLISY
jgi:hypothetical protein